MLVSKEKIDKSTSALENVTWRGILMNKSDFLNLIDARNNGVIDKLKECNDNGLRLFIYGAGEGAENIEKRFSAYANFAGRIVDKKYYRGETGTFPLEDILGREKINIIVGHKGFNKSKLEAYEKNIGLLIDMDCFAGNYEIDPELFSREYVEENVSSLLKVYNQLEDDISRKHYIAYINQKISMDYKYLDGVYLDEDQYFLEDIIKFVDNECFVDCGAYTGDTADAFVKRIEADGGRYQAIHSFEPDKHNYEILQERKIKRLHSYCLATGKEKMEMHFSSKGKGSSSGLTFDVNAETIKVDTIDNILQNQRVTFIKMDVEGYELDSLTGAESVIRKNKPKLAICIYHKKEDLWQIQEYIKSLIPEYKFYVRAYEKTATELVLYAVV